MDQTDPLNPRYYEDGISVTSFILSHKLDFVRGNIVKYVVRAGRKDPATELQDLEKARWYINRAIEELNK